MRLTRDNYYSHAANVAYMSVSQFKAFERCQTAAMAELRATPAGEASSQCGDAAKVGQSILLPPSTALLVGSYVDAWFEGELPAFCRSHPEIYKRDGTLKAEFLQADDIIERVRKDALFMAYMGGEKQVIMTGEIAGVAVKIRMDSYHPDTRGLGGDSAALARNERSECRGKPYSGGFSPIHGAIVDLKVMRDFEDVYVPDVGRVPWYEGWGYDLQGAVYQEVVRQNTGKKLPFFLAAATKERVTDIDLIQLDQDMLDAALEHVAEMMPLYDAIKKGVIPPERCEKCDYCKITKVLTEPHDSNDFI